MAFHRLELLAVAVSAVVSLTAHADQVPVPKSINPGSLVSPLRDKRVQEELKLSNDELLEVLRRVDGVMDKYKEENRQLMQLSGEELRKKRNEFNKRVSAEVRKVLGEVLQPHQVKRLRQFELQRLSVAAFLDEEVQGTLKIVPEQKQKINTIYNELLKEQALLSKNFKSSNVQEAVQQLKALHHKQMQKVLGILDENQKVTWDGLRGKLLGSQ